MDDQLRQRIRKIIAEELERLVKEQCSEVGKKATASTAGLTADWQLVQELLHETTPAIDVLLSGSRSLVSESISLLRRLAESPGLRRIYLPASLTHLYSVDSIQQIVGSPNGKKPPRVIPLQSASDVTSDSALDQSGSLVILPLSHDLMGRLIAGELSHPPVSLIYQYLDKKVRVHGTGCTLSCDGFPKRTGSILHQQTNHFLRQVENLGVQYTADSSDLVRAIQPNRSKNSALQTPSLYFLTVNDLRTLDQKGVARIILRYPLTITPEARDLARELKIELIEPR
jgi:hypothetical protein